MVAAVSVIDRSGLSLDASEFRDVTFSEMPFLMRAALGGRATAITLGDHIFVQSEVFDGLVAGHQPDLVIHELVHVTQWRADGGSFLPRYVAEYVRLRLLGVPHETAYRSISYEAEAFAASTRY